MKRNIQNIEDWPGWPRFMKFYDACDNTSKPEDARLYFATLFESGCRESEAILLKPEQFAISDEAIYIKSVVVLKKRKAWTRNVLISRDDNPIADELVAMVEDCDTEYLLPARLPFSGHKRPYGHVSRGTVYNRISEIPGLFPHALRAYRACHLVAERGFSVQDLVAWFHWKNATLAIHYTRTRDMAKRMGIDLSALLGGF